MIPWLQPWLNAIQSHPPIVESLGPALGDLCQHRLSSANWKPGETTLRFSSIFGHADHDTGLSYYRTKATNWMSKA